MDSPVLRKEGKHYQHKDTKFWAEEGMIVIERQEDGNCDVVFCSEFAARAVALNRMAAREKYASDQRDLNSWVDKMISCLQDAKAQGDPADPEVIKQRYKDRRRAIVVTGMW